MEGCVARCWRLPAGASVCWRRLKTDVAAAGGCWQMPARRGERHLPGRRFHFRRLHGHRGRGRGRGGCHRFEAVRLHRGYALRGSGGGCVDRLRLALPACRGGGANVIDPQDPTQGEAGEAEGLGQKRGVAARRDDPRGSTCLENVGLFVRARLVDRPISNRRKSVTSCLCHRSCIAWMQDLRRCSLLLLCCIAVWLAVSLYSRCLVQATVGQRQLPSATRTPRSTFVPRRPHTRRPAPPRPSHIPPLAPAQRRSRGPSRGATAGS